MQDLARVVMEIDLWAGRRFEIISGKCAGEYGEFCENDANKEI
jgi:hypothetical protein